MDNMQLSNKNKSQLKINLTGSYTIEPIEKNLNYWLEKITIPAVLNFVGFNQIFQQLINPGSDFNSSNSSLNIVFIRFEDILSIDTNSKERSSIFSELLDGILFSINNAKNSKLLVVFCPASDKTKKDHKILSEYSYYEERVTSIEKLHSNLLLINSIEFFQKYKLDDYYEPLGENIGNIPYNEDFFIVASTLIARKIYSLNTLPFKAIVVDCDNTIWKGIVGEDGAENVEIKGKELELQKFLISQYKCGVLLCLCSKNVEQDVWDVFELNKNMLLKKEHIAFSRINWLPKSKNIIDLAKDINIGLDSFIFIDDNPLECNEVSLNIPSVLTIQKKLDLDNIDYILNSWIFDKDNYTQEDTERTKMYQLEAERRHLNEKMKSYTDFINSLNIKVTTEPASLKEVSRVSQLSYRTNQFNTTSFRRSEEEIKEICNSKSSLVFYTKLKDKFGEYGIIGSLIATIKSNNLFVDNFLLSCRALGKGVEHAMISYLGNIGANLGIDIISIRFIKSEKNIVAENFLVDNFKEFIRTIEKETIFEIPVNVAINFTFDPNKFCPQEQDKSEKLNISSIKSGILSRNEFYNDIINNYSDLKSIRNKLASKNTKAIIPDFCTDTEASLLKIWQDELQNSDISLDDNFFDVGGKSINIPPIIIQCIKQLDVKIKIVDIFQYPTVKALAKFLENSHNELKNEVVTQETLNNFRKQRNRFKKFKQI